MYAEVTNKKGDKLAAHWVGSTLIFLHPYTGQEMKKVDALDVPTFEPLEYEGYMELLEKNKTLFPAPVYNVGDKIPALGKVDEVWFTDSKTYQYRIKKEWFAETVLQGAFFAAKAKSIGFEAVWSIVQEIFKGKAENLPFLQYLNGLFYAVGTAEVYEGKWGHKKDWSLLKSQVAGACSYKPVKSKELLKLEQELECLEEKLQAEKSRLYGIQNKMGWGHGMRHAKVMPFSFTKQNEIEAKIKSIKEQIKQL